MLTRLHVQGYKALWGIDTTLEPLTVIVGPNGCGKTSVLESVALVRDSFAAPSPLEAHSLEDLRSKRDAERLDIAIELSTRLDHARQEQPADEVTLSFGSKGGPHTSIDWEGRPRIRDPHQLDHPRSVAARAHLCSSRLLALDIKALARPSYLREISPRVEDDGSGLATVLSTLIGERREAFEEIQHQLRELVPEVERILIRPASIPVVQAREVPVGLDKDGKEVLATRHYQQDVIGHEVFFDFHHAKGVRARHASEGTLLLLGLLTVINSERVGVLLLDDIDRALHPKAQQLLVAYLRRISQQGVQTIATTHSPYLVLHLEYEEVRIMTMSDTDGALIGKLSDHPEHERWREDMTPSEFWTVFGEQWLARARADG